MAIFDPIGIIQVLARYGVDYVLIGGLAGSLHGSPATTNDADIVPDPNPQNLERLGGVLSEINARLRVEGEPEGVEFDPHPVLLGSMAVLNMTTTLGDLDLTARPSGLDGYAAIRERAVHFDVDGIPVLVASLDDVIHSKEVADRPKDRATLPLLRALRDEIAE